MSQVQILKPIVPDICARMIELVKEDPNISQEFKEALK